MLLQVVKELATGRLARTKTSLQSVTPEIFHVLGNIYVDKVNRWQGFLHNGGDGSIAFDDIQNSLLLIKVIRRLLIAGYEFPNRDSEVTEFWGLVTDKLAQFLQVLSAVGMNMALEFRTLIEKSLTNLSKLHHEMCSTHPAAFVLLPGSMRLVGAYWSLITDFGNDYNKPSPLNTLFTIGTDGDADPDEKSIGEKLSLKGLQIVRLCVKMVHNPTKSFKYRQPQEKEEMSQATAEVKAELLTDAFVLQALDVLVTKFFVLRQSDLRSWEQEPDEWEKMEEGISEEYDFTIRACAEKAFLDLAIHYKQITVQPLLTALQSIICEYHDGITVSMGIH